jgi:hypothetical protein
MTKNPAPPPASPAAGRTGAARMETDDESGTQGVPDDGDDERRRALFALDAMFKRGLLAKEEYERRKTGLMKKPSAHD